MRVERKPKDQLALASTRLATVEQAICFAEVGFSLRAGIRYPLVARGGLEDVLLEARDLFVWSACQSFDDCVEFGHSFGLVWSRLSAQVSPKYFRSSRAPVRKYSIFSASAFMPRA